MPLEEDKLRDLLSGQAEKERAAYKRASLLIGLAAGVGLLWLGFSAYEVIKLERRAAEIREEIAEKTKQLNELNEDTLPKVLELGEVKDNLDKAEEALKTIAAGTESPKQKAEKTLEKISVPAKPNEKVPVNVPGPLTTPFLMPIEDVFSIAGRGVVVTGRVQRGKAKVGDPVDIVGFHPTKQTVVTGVEMFRKVLDEALAGDNVGLLLRGVERKDVERGQVVAAAGSIKAHTKFAAKIELLETERGGRHSPVSTGYRPQFYFRTTDVTGVMNLPGGVSQIAPGDKNIEVTIELAVPVAVEPDLRFAIREGGRTVGAGVVTKIIQ